jgi:hypothetical protein
MEQIDFIYKFTFPDGKTKDVHLHLIDQDEIGLNASDVCEAFIDFMKSAGFTEEQVERYFRY